MLSPCQETLPLQPLYVLPSYKAMEEITKFAKFQFEKLPEDQKSHLKKTFSEFDDDDDGKIDPLKLLCSFALPELVGRDMLFFNQFADDSDGRLDFDRFLAFWYVGDRSLNNCNWCTKILPVVYFACRKCGKDNKEFKICFDCFEKREYYHKHSSEDFEDINTLKPIESKRSPRAEDDYPVGSAIRQRYLAKELKAIGENRSRIRTNFAVMTAQVGDFLEMLANGPPPDLKDDKKSDEKEDTIGDEEQAAAMDS